MNPDTARQIRQALANHHRPPRTAGARTKEALEHARQSPLRAMLEIERKRRAQQKREGCE